MKILSEIAINLSSEHELTIIRRNRLFLYLSKRYREKIILKYLNAKHYDYIVCCRETAKIISERNLAHDCVIQLTSTGYDGVPIGNLNSEGIKVINIRNIYTIPISEFVIYGILCFLKRMRSNPNNMKPKLFRNYDLMNELFQKKALVLSLGNIGMSIAEKLRAFNVDVDGYDPYVTLENNDIVQNVYQTKEQIFEKLNKYDLIISTMPLVQDTFGFCDSDFFNNCSSNLIFCNVGRKETVDNDYLYAVLKKRKIKGAIIDEVELLPFKLFNKFRRLSNVLFYPGISTSTQEAVLRRDKQIIKNIIDYNENLLLNNEVEV